MLKIDLTNLKSEAHKLDTDKLEKVPIGLVPVPIALIKLSDVIRNHVVKKDGYKVRNKRYWR